MKMKIKRKNITTKGMTYGINKKEITTHYDGKIIYPELISCWLVKDYISIL